MKARPILFSGPMVRAILEGRKTQTRRVVRICDEPITKAQFDACARQKGIPTNAVNVRNGYGYLKCDAPAGSHTVSSRVSWPYGYPGDRLWVKETFKENVPPSGWLYRATDELATHADKRPWRPSIHMPRCASRLWLEIVSVRVERLNEISEADAKAEGIEPVQYPAPGMVANVDVRYKGTFWRNYTSPIVAERYARQSFTTLWESINGRGTWELNPWVWVIEFKRVESGVSA